MKIIYLSVALAAGAFVLSVPPKCAAQSAPVQATPAAVSAAPSDPEIANIVVTANTIDIDAGKLAEKKSKNPKVKDFAKEMVKDHTALNHQATQLAKKIKITPKDNATSEGLKTGAKENVANLKKLSGADFDKAYIDHEVEFHQAVLKAIDETLLPNAKNGDLKELLTKARPTIEAHLNHAKQVQSTL